MNNSGCFAKWSFIEQTNPWMKNILNMSNIGGGRKPIYIGIDDAATKAPSECITIKYLYMKMVIPTRYKC